VYFGARRVCSPYNSVLIFSFCWCIALPSFKPCGFTPDNLSCVFIIIHYAYRNRFLTPSNDDLNFFFLSNRRVFLRNSGLVLPFFPVAPRSVTANRSVNIASLHWRNATSVTVRVVVHLIETPDPITSSNSSHVPVSAPLISLLPLSILDVHESAILRIHTRLIFVDSDDDFVPFPAGPARILGTKHGGVYDAGNKTQSDVCKDDAMTERVPRSIGSAINVGADGSV